MAKRRKRKKAKRSSSGSSSCMTACKKACRSTKGGKSKSKRSNSRKASRPYRPRGRGRTSAGRGDATACLMAACRRDSRAYREMGCYQSTGLSMEVNAGASGC